MKRIAVILARGGSKRLPRKNILDFFGKPLVAWTIAAAIDSGRFSRVLVSTDDEEIASVARGFGAEVPFLRKAAVDDHSPASEATLVALEQAESHWGEQFDVVVQLMANCPLRGAPEIRAALEQFENNGFHPLISCFRFGWMNPWWAVSLNDEGQPSYLFEDALNARSQDLPALFCPTGAIWVARTETLRAAKSFRAPGHRFFPIDWISAVDIDDDADMTFAKACYLLKTT